MTVSLKADEKTKMGIITEIKTELRKAEALKINYSAKKKVVDASNNKIRFDTNKKAARMRRPFLFSIAKVYYLDKALRQLPGRPAAARSWQR
jgi:hypothetical protein